MGHRFAPAGSMTRRPDQSWTDREHGEREALPVMVGER